jgi:hypothetical protein
MACDSLLSADVVTADGQVLVASATTNSDLFWALRGGGGNFGVVTSFEYRLHPVGPMIAFAGPVYPLESTPEVMAQFREFAANAPDEVNVSATWWTIPAVQEFPKHTHGQQVLILGGVYIGAPEIGEQALSPLRAFTKPMLDLSASLPYTTVQQLFDPFFPPGQMRYYWKSLYLAGLERETIEEIQRWIERRPSAMSMIGVWVLGGALSRVSAEETATGERDAPFLLEILANWTDAEHSDTNVAWARDCFEAMKRFGTGKTNFNFPGLAEDPQFVRTSVGRHYDRLVAAKRRYDPSNLFRLNQNIDPTDR